MNLHARLREREAQGKPLRVGLIGAGGYGQPIITGTRLNDIAIIMQGAIPAALMAIAVQALFDYSERFLVPRGLRVAASKG